MVKPYRYTIYKRGQPSVITMIAQSGQPAPKTAPSQEYSSVTEQLRREEWDMRDGTEQDVRALNHAVEHAGFARQGGRQ